MAKTDFKSMDEYIASQPDPVRAALKRVRTTVRKALPGAEELISYQIPAFRLDGRMLVAFGAAAKFPPDCPLPVALVRKLVRTRIAEQTARQSGTARAKRKRRR